jgi:hypothetical protein
MQFPDSGISGEFDEPEIAKGIKKRTANNGMRI